MSTMTVVGRGAELGAIDRALTAAGAGPGTVIIVGDPGIGKTTLWRYAATAARERGYLIMCCRGAEWEKRLSFSGLADLMELVPDQALGTLPAFQREALEVARLKRTAPETGTDHRAICLAVTRVVRRLAEVQPVVIAVDDVHWLDAPTVEVLAYMFRRLESEPVLLLVTARGGPVEALPSGLGQALGDERMLRVHVGPLSPEALHELVREHTGIVLSRPELLRLHGASGGNPLFAIEIAWALLRSGARPIPGEPLPVPESLADLVTARVSELPERTREALLVTSALAHPAVDQVQAVMCGEDSPGSAGHGLLDAAEEGGIVEIRDGHVRFTHPLFSSSIYSSAPAARRRAVHRRLADVASDVEEQAWHLALAVDGPDENVAAVVEKAARAAQARGAIGAAAALWELAIRRTPAADPPGTSRRTVAAAVCLFTAGDAARARPMLEAVIPGMTAGRHRARAMLWLASILYYEDSSVAAAAMCRDALAEAGDDQLLRATLHLRAAWFAEHDTPGRVRDAEAAVEILDGGGVTADPDMLACALLARGYYRFLAGRGIDGDDLARGRRLLSARGLSWERSHAISLIYHWDKVLDPAHARTYLAALLPHAIERGNEPGVAHVLTHLAETECWLGQLAQARVHAAEAAAVFEQTGQRRWQGLALYIQALPDAYLGRVRPARAAAEAGLAIASAAGDPYVAALHLGVLGFLALSGGELAAAEGFLGRAEELVGLMGLAEPARHRFQGDLVEAVAGRGDVARAGVMVGRLEERAAVAGYPWLAIVAARSRAVVRAAGGDLDGGIAAAEQALGGQARVSMPFEYGRALLVAGQIRRRRKEKLLARDALVEARQIFEDLKTPLWSAHAAAELGRLGLRSTAAHDLTPAEERVARMVARGLTNREVASALYVSHKTVEASLGRIYRKLGIRSRRELSSSAAFGQE